MPDAKNKTNETVENINFYDGFQKVTVNSDPNRVIQWNPLDISFVDRFLAFQSWVENEFTAKVKALDIDKAKDIDSYQQGIFTELGNELNNAIDGMFQSKVSDTAFAGVNPISPMSDGNLLFMNFLNALMPLINKSVKEFEDARKKYTAVATRKSSTNPAFKKP